MGTHRQITSGHQRDLFARTSTRSTRSTTSIRSRQRCGLSGIYGRKPEKMSALARELEIERSTTDWQQILYYREVDVVANAGAHPLHAPTRSPRSMPASTPVREPPPWTRSTLEQWSRRQRRLTFSLHAASITDSTRNPCRTSTRYRRPTWSNPPYRGLFLRDWLSNDPTSLGRRRLRPRLRPSLRHAPLFRGRAFGSHRNSREHPQRSRRHVSGRARDARWRARASLEGRHARPAGKPDTGLRSMAAKDRSWWDMATQQTARHARQGPERGPREVGLREVLVTEKTHPLLEQWWEAGHIIGWESTFVHEWRAFLSAVDCGQTAGAVPG